MSANDEGWPRYCCAILVDGAGRFWMEERPAGARAAEGEVTCFGGACEAGESPEGCVRRELAEELGWTARELRLGVRLVVGGELVAWFFVGAAPESEDAVRLEPGRRLVIIGADEIGSGRVSPWHAAALRAHLAGEPVARVA